MLSFYCYVLMFLCCDGGAGTDVNKAFETMRLFEPRGPLINSEYYPGWLDYWGDPHSTVKAEVSLSSSFFSCHMYVYQ